MLSEPTFSFPGRQHLVEAFASGPFFRWVAPLDETWQRFGPAWLSMIAARRRRR